jgi:transcription elongation GreA/GreB family factor
VGATLGSLVRIHYHEFGDKVNFILAGSQQQLTPDYMEKLAEYYPGEPVEMFSVSSPIGRYVLGKFADETFDFNYGNGEKTKITVESVRHINL